MAKIGPFSTNFWPFVANSGLFEKFLKTFNLLQKLEKYFLETYLKFSKISLLKDAIKSPFFVLKFFQKIVLNYFLQFEIFRKLSHKNAIKTENKADYDFDKGKMQS